jgi:Fe-S cluster assembly protein SufD
MYKSLMKVSRPVSPSKPAPYYTLHELSEYLCSESYLTNCLPTVSTPENNLDYYNNAVSRLSLNGLPSIKDERYNTANLNKLYNIDILSTPGDLQQWSKDDFFTWLSKFDYVATRTNYVATCDGDMICSSDIDTKQSNVKTYSKLRPNHRQSEYFSYLSNAKGFGDFTISTCPYPNVVVINKSSRDEPICLEYMNSCDDPIMESNANIVDIKPNADISIMETVRQSAGQLNYVVYIVRENSTLHLTRNTHSRSGAWGIFDSVFICYPGSKVTVDTKSAGSQYQQESFFVELSKDAEFNLNGRNALNVGNQLNTFVEVESMSTNNTSNIDVRHIGRDSTHSSFIGKFIVNNESSEFNGSMNNHNLMLSDSATMHTRPILDIKTKEIECSHGCTISNIDKDLLYYLETRGVPHSRAHRTLIESFLC